MSFGLSETTDDNHITSTTIDSTTSNKIDTTSQENISTTLLVSTEKWTIEASDSDHTSSATQEAVAFSENTEEITSKIQEEPTTEWTFLLDSRKTTAMESSQDVVSTSHFICTEETLTQTEASSINTSNDYPSMYKEDSNSSNKARIVGDRGSTETVIVFTEDLLRIISETMSLSEKPTVETTTGQEIVNLEISTEK